METGEHSTPRPAFAPLPIWGGIECTVNRVGEHYFDQMARNGHWERIEDLDLLAAYGFKTLRYPFLWEHVSAKSAEDCDWSWHDARVERMRRLGIEPIAGLLHHGSGPAYTNLLDAHFPEKLAVHAARVAERYPEIRMYTPVNEPLTTARFSCLYGLWYPHACDDSSFLRALLLECKGTALAMKTIRRYRPDAQLVQTEDLGYTRSTRRLAYQAEFENSRRWLTWDLLCGKVTPSHDLYRWIRKRGITAEELDWFVQNPCPPDVLGINYYVTSERYLDHQFENYPEGARGGNGKDCYADVETVRVSHVEMAGPQALIQEASDRYGLPIAITEAHLGCTREEQCRWLRYVYEQAESARREGADVRAVTVWSLLGAFDWNGLLTQNLGHYESGAFDVRTGRPRATALALEAKRLACGDPLPPREKGWWERSVRAFYPRDLSRPPLDGEEFGQMEQPILITGASGTLGRAFARLCELRGLPYRLLSRRDMDIADPASIEAALSRIRPTAVVNAAGYVRVDDAEHDQKRCYRENVEGPAALAAACSARGIKLVTFSSDLVFDGEKGSAYVESDPVNPLNVYGRSKAEAEARILQLMPDALVVRTSAFFGPWDEYNFVHHVVTTLRKGEIVEAVADQYVSPTYVPELVNTTLDLLQDEESGLWHIANRGVMSWAEFARLTARTFGLNPKMIHGVRGAERQVAKRPTNSGLKSERGSPMHGVEHAMVKLFDEIEMTVRAAERDPRQQTALYFA